MFKSCNTLHSLGHSDIRARPDIYHVLDLTYITKSDLLVFKHVTSCLISLSVS